MAAAEGVCGACRHHSPAYPESAPRHPLRLTRIQLNEERPVEAYTDGSTWNGYLRPHFTLAQGKAFLEADPFFRGVYDEAKDRFVFPAHPEEDPYPHEADPEWSGEGKVWDPPDVFGPEMVLVDGKPLKVYAIGADGWVWVPARG